MIKELVEPFKRKDGSKTPAFGVVITNLSMFLILLWLNHPTLSGLPLAFVVVFLIGQYKNPAQKKRP